LASASKASGERVFTEAHLTLYGDQTMQGAIAGVLSLTEQPFIQDQDSLHNPLGLILTFAMVAVAAFLCSAVIFLSV
jgi:hypothetical protein